MVETKRIEVPEEELESVPESSWIAEEELQPIKEEKISHDELRNKIAEIGKCEGKYVQVEYPIDHLKLDVVWKTVSTSSPGWAFEVQLSGNFYEALTKLMHAWTKWNCRPFLVTTDKYIEQAKSLIEGSFHGMRDDIRLVEWKKMLALWEYAMKAFDIKKEVRL